jgi:peptidoglycan/xylan/chitin deacetylase (PgdA/CDA1 family)/archaellum component FlaF (FlaF/FlaG flagellin family)
MSSRTRPHRTTKRKGTCRRALLGLTATIALAICGLFAVAGPASATTPQTIVSLTFDDGSASQYWARSELASHGMHATFYINSARVGSSSYYMDWSQIHDLYADGNEIGGHTADHVNLPQIDPAEAQRQICHDRVNLLNQGFQPTDFAYPYGSYNSSVEQMAQGCGYNSARTTTETVAESIPPADPYALRVAHGSDLASLQASITNAEQHGGGWVQLVFHQICNGCDTDWISRSDFTALLDWLQPRSANGTVVETMHDVIGGPVQPGTEGPGAPAAPNGWSVLRNASLEYDTNTDAAPDCWQFDAFGSHSATWSRTSDAHTGSWAERVDVSNYTSGDEKLLTAQDLGFCTPSVTPGHRYSVTAWYKSDASPYFTAFTRDAIGAFSFWTGSTSFAPSSTWQKATWVTPVIPAGVTGISFGLTLASNGFLTVDDLGLDDASPTGSADTTAPTVSITSPSAGATVAGNVTISAAASDNIAVDHVDFLVDGSVVGTATHGPYSFNWAARNATNGSHTLTARAVDPAGNTRTSTPVAVTVSNSFTNLLQNPSLETASGSTPSCWLLGGYGTNSFAWTRTSDAHTGSFGETLNVSSWTNGDRKLVSAQDAGICAPSATPGHTYTVGTWYKAPTGSVGQPVIFAYYRNSAGSWVYWAQSPKLASASTWTNATWTTPAVPAGATALSIGLGLTSAGAVTMDDFSLFDNTPPPDVTAPTSTINCTDASGQSDDGGCISGYYGDPVLVTLTAADDAVGSGVASIRYTTDGSDPSLTNGSTYGGPFTVGATSTVKFRAYDKAGNAEPVRSQLIKIDTLPPSSTIACNAAVCQNGFYGSAVSVSLAGADTGGAGLREIRYTTDGSDPTAANGNTYLGPFSVTSTTNVKYRAFDNAGNAEAVNSQSIQVDTTAPSTTITCGQFPCSSAPYSGSIDVSLTASDGGSGVAAIRYTTDGTDPTPTNGNLYTGTFTLTSTTTVKYRAYDNAGNAEAVNSRTINVQTASVTLTSPTDGTTVSGATNLTASVQAISVDHVDFLVDGTVVGSTGTTPYSVSWDSTTVADGSHTIVARVFDTNGVETDSNTVTVTVSNQVPDNTPPTSTISCNGSACSSGFYNSAVSVALSAVDDANGSGVASIRYTTDGSDPTSSNGTVYGGAFSVAGTTTVKYRAYDNAGNAEPVNSQLVQVDTVAPGSSISCNGATCASSYYGSAVSVALSATDTGGSGVKAIRYTTDGSDPTTSNGTDYSAPFSLSGTATVKYRAFDNAGNAEPVNSALIRVDTIAPSSAIKCNGGSCSNAYFKPGAAVTITATDADSGVASIRYTTDGTTPTATAGTVYSGSFSVNATTTVKYRAFDSAGNAEAVNSQLVQIDPTSPTASLTSPNAGALVSGTVSLAASASDNVAVDHVDFLVDGQTVGTASSAPYTFGWDSRTVGDGSHALAAKAVDSAGNATTSSSVSVTVANTNLLQNPSLETAAGSTPTCWVLGGYGTNSFTWTRTSDAHAGSFGEALNVTSWTNGDRKLVSAQDAGACAPTANPGHTFTVTGWYKTPSQPVIFAYYRSSAGSWVYWAQSAKLAVASNWTQAIWTTPAVPAGATNLSVGIGLSSAGSVTMDDFGLYPTG